MPGKTELQLLEQMERNDRFFRSNYTSLRERYPNQFVAIDGGKLLMAAPSMGDLREALEAKKADIATMIIQFIPKKGLVFI